MNNGPKNSPYQSLTPEQKRARRNAAITQKLDTDLAGIIGDVEERIKQIREYISLLDRRAQWLRFGSTEAEETAISIFISQKAEELKTRVKSVYGEKGLKVLFYYGAIAGTPGDGATIEAIDFEGEDSIAKWFDSVEQDIKDKKWK
jgi:hypothetical protein